jgi:hypothetical protein
MDHSLSYRSRLLRRLRSLRAREIHGLRELRDRSVVGERRNANGAIVTSVHHHIDDARFGGAAAACHIDVELRCFVETKKVSKQRGRQASTLEASVPLERPVSHVHFFIIFLFSHSHIFE